MTTFADEIETAAAGPIEAVVIGSNGWAWDTTAKPEIGAFEPCDWPLNVLVPWNEARKWLERDYDRGYGGPECPAITAWSADRVVFVYQYDGATGVVWVPRNPCDHTPSMPGG